MSNPQHLKSWAEAFAEDLNNTFKGVLGSSCPSFEAIQKQNGGGRLVVQSEDAELIPLSINKEHALDLSLTFHCTWDSAKTFLKVEKADYHLFPAGGGTPLFRYEFVDGLSDRRVPSAHLQLHAHRDEFLFAMLRAQKGKPRARTSAATGGKGKVPMLASIHFPLGGPRFRPCVEDILQLLIYEFGIDSEKSTAKGTLDKGRAEWRRRQTRAVVRDAPSEAMAVLKGLGYQVVPPADGPPSDNGGLLTRV